MLLVVAPVALATHDGSDVPHDEMPQEQPVGGGLSTPATDVQSEPRPATTTAGAPTPTGDTSVSSNEVPPATTGEPTMPAAPAPTPEGVGAPTESVGEDYTGPVMAGVAALVVAALGAAAYFLWGGSAAESSAAGEDPCEHLRIELGIKEKLLDELKDRVAKAVGLEEAKKLHDSIAEITSAIEVVRANFQVCLLEAPDVAGRKKLLFDAAEVPQVVSKALTTVERVPDSLDVEEGDSVILVSKGTGKRFGVGTITGIIDIPQSDKKLVNFRVERASVEA